MFSDCGGGSNVSHFRQKDDQRAEFGASKQRSKVNG